MIKIITGFRDDQHYSISDNEAHKAYYLFNNPEKRGVFENGVALIGKNIQGIEPDWNATMGWNPSHKLEGDDWNEIRANQVDVRLRATLEAAKRVAQIAEKNPKLLELPLSDITQGDDNLLLEQ